jgi:hypothetical protein
LWTLTPWGADQILFDDPPATGTSLGFLASPGHYLLFAWDDSNQPVGFISGVEMTHPDKGKEMYLNELGVAEGARRQGVASRLTGARARFVQSFAAATISPQSHRSDQPRHSELPGDHDGWCFFLGARTAVGIASAPMLSGSETSHIP